MLERAKVVIDVRDPIAPDFLDFFKVEHNGRKKEVEIIAIVDSEKKVLHYEMGYKKHNPYRGSHTSGNFLDARTHEPATLSEETKAFLRWFIGGLADEHVEKTPPFIMNLKDRASTRHWTDRQTRTIEVSEHRGWLVPRFISLTVDPKDFELYNFFLMEARVNRRQTNLRWFARTVNYHTRSHKTIRGKGFGEIRKILANQREFLEQSALEDIVPQLVRKDLVLEWLEVEHLITSWQAGELAKRMMSTRSGSGPNLRIVRNGFKRSGCVSFSVYGRNKIPEPTFQDGRILPQLQLGLTEEI
ncbi:MAG: hypothetical protein Q8R12_04865 [bacterium]|nr:hypothetical protein [bacterium]